MTKKKAWILAAFISVILVFVLPELPLAWGIVGLIAVCMLAFR